MKKKANEMCIATGWLHLGYINITMFSLENSASDPPTSAAKTENIENYIYILTAVDTTQVIIIRFVLN